jgi:predicted acylesterase/phospholipase RssA
MIETSIQETSSVNGQARQHKLLGIDGGGVRGVLAIEILAKLERDLADAHGVPREEYRLSDFFDYVSGTSTGAVLAACVARGLSTDEMFDFYLTDSKVMFDNRWWRKALALRYFGTAYDARPLARKLRNLFGEETTLEPGNLECLFLAVTRNQTTDSPWPISSNPKAKYNDASLLDCNLKIPLWQIVRASTAAPLAYEPEKIQWDPNDPNTAFWFVDGGVTPYNNPTWLLYRMATEPGYNLNWPTGEDKMLVISVGTGSSPKGDDGALVERSVLGRLLGSAKIPGALIQSSMVDQDTNCRQVGRCVSGAVIDSEIGDMIPRNGEMDPNDSYRNRIPLETDLAKKFLYARYNVHLEQKVLDGLGLQDIAVETVQKLNAVEKIPELRRVGERIADDIDINDFAPFLSKQPV